MLLWPRCSLWLRRHHTTGFVIADEAAVIIGLFLLLDGTAIDAVQIAERLIGHVGTDHEADAAVRRPAEPVDVASELRAHGKNGFAQCLAFDEIVGKLVERTIKVVIRAPFS